jgi:hypothetical protein
VEKDVNDLVQRASESVDNERRLLESGVEPAASSAPPTASLPAWPDCSEELLQANAQYDPAALFPNTRAAGLKRLILRVLNVYTYRQILFNAAVVRVLNRWEPVLRPLAGESRRLTYWLTVRIARLEERRTLWEARLVGRLAALEDRTSAAESDFAELQARSRDDRARLDALEDSVKRLQALLARERERAGAGTSR